MMMKMMAAIVRVLISDVARRGRRTQTHLSTEMIMVRHPELIKKTHVDAHDVAAHGPLPPGLEVRSEEGEEAGGAGQSEEEDEHAVDQGQTEQAQVHPVLQTCTKTSSKVMIAS